MAYSILSLGFLLEAPVTFEQAPELFCLDLYKDFDLDRLATISAPTQVKWEALVKKSPEKTALQE